MSLDWTLILLAAAFLICVALALLDRLALWMERRGWIRWRKFKPTDAVRGSIGVFQEFVQPEIRHVQQDTRQRQAIRLDEEGGPPKFGNDRSATQADDRGQS